MDRASRKYPSLRIIRLAQLMILLTYIPHVYSHGMTTFQCPNGFYISKFNSAYDGSERLYQFGCSKFSNTIMSFEEECTTTESASTANGDMYLSCGSDQYTVGVEIIEDVASSVDSWQLLCCKSSSVRIRTGDCIDTKFINDHRRAASFSSSAQIVRRWQAMAENGDRRWWLQICPIDLDLKRPTNVGEIRARRQVPWEWQRGRFPGDITSYNPFFLDQMKRDEEERRKMFQNMVQTGQTSPPSSAKLTENPPNIFGSVFLPPPILPTIKFPQNDALRIDIPTTTTRMYKQRTFGAYKSDRIQSLGMQRTTLTPTLSSPSTKESTTEKAIEAIDYYDLYDENFDKKKHTEGGLLRGVSDLLQNLQDGLTLAQVAFPQRDGSNSFHLKLGLPSTTTQPKFMFANDEDSLQIGSFIQQTDNKKAGPYPKPPPRPTTTEAPTHRGNAIENILQMAGLCNGHN